MSTESVRALFERVNSDGGFGRRLEEAQTPEDKYQLITQAGFDINRQDLEVIKSLTGLEELSDDYLAQVVGGAAGAQAGRPLPEPDGGRDQMNWS
ncbi:MAG TPA: Nif11-like leader peptide family natural product precursor [Acidimicrobiales bacterium]|jgi:predicted ribosomally synthesized peptide with nif11-like leader